MEILFFIIGLAIIVFGLYMNYRIVAKAGFSGWWSLILLVPILNFVMIWLFAFKPWPAVDGPSLQPAYQPPSKAQNPDSEFQAPPPPPPPDA